jgi:trehalose 6-phosphate synthase/phosphatase
VAARAAAIRSEAGGRRIILGVDRLDYTKGVRRRFLTIERLLAREPEFSARIRMIQLAVPSRGGIDAYDDFRRSVDEVVGRVNGLYATSDSVVIHYMYRSLSQRELVAMYRAADVMLVTPLRDGMNLVAKEYVSARNDDSGALILSPFTGAARELPDALIVNPYDTEQLADAIRYALGMAPDEQHRRMSAMRAQIRTSNVYRWAADLVSDVAGVRVASPDPFGGA